jgi:hypothetical protein
MCLPVVTILAASSRHLRPGWWILVVRQRVVLGGLGQGSPSGRRITTTAGSTATTTPAAAAATTTTTAAAATVT